MGKIGDDGCDDFVTEVLYRRLESMSGKFAERAVGSSRSSSGELTRSATRIESKAGQLSVLRLLAIEEVAKIALSGISQHDKRLAKNFELIIAS